MSEFEKAGKSPSNTSYAQSPDRLVKRKRVEDSSSPTEVVPLAEVAAPADIPQVDGSGLDYNEERHLSPDQRDDSEYPERVPDGERTLRNYASLDEDRKLQAAVNTADPPLPNEQPPPLPDEAPPGTDYQDDGWEAEWDGRIQKHYFWNRFTGVRTWLNPRVPPASNNTNPPNLNQGAPGVLDPARGIKKPDNDIHPAVLGGYNPAIHGSYDPNADYANAIKPADTSTTYPSSSAGVVAPGTLDDYSSAATFNRFTGRFQSSSLTTENFNDDSKSRRQMNAYFDVDRAANNHDGRSLKAERQNKKLTKAEIKEFREKRKERKEEKKRAWLRDLMNQIRRKLWLRL